MINKKQNRSAEDILTDDGYIDEIVNEHFKDEQLQDEELKFASDIYQAVQSNRIVFNKDEKYCLDQRIIGTINKSKQRRTLLWFTSAAGILIIVGLTSVLHWSDRSDIRDFASRMAYGFDTESTQLMLTDNKKIEIDSKESQIEYSKSGNEISIDTLEQIIQNANSASVDFNTVLVPYGKRAQIQLSDQSVVWLNSGSKLVYPARFLADKREVYLEGEALFEVSHDLKHPFHVLTRDMEIKVLGTVFNVSAYNDDDCINTILVSGMIELNAKSNTFLQNIKEKMAPGMLAVYDLSKKTLEQTNVNAKNYTSWKDGYVVLDRKPLGYIAKKLSRYYNVNIQFGDLELAEESFSGYLDLRNSAAQVLEMIAEMVEIEIKQTDHQIIIARRPK